MSLKREDLKVGGEYLSPKGEEIKVTFIGRDLCVYMKECQHEFCSDKSFALDFWSLPEPKKVYKKFWFKSWKCRNDEIRSVTDLYSCKNDIFLQDGAFKKRQDVQLHEIEILVDEDA
jgi:hypothetical protein